MGVKERRERRIIEVRRSIMDAALRLNQEKGAQGITVRAIASLIDYSPSVLYEYFGSKEAILAEIRRESVQLFLDEYANASADSLPAEDHFRRLLRLYWNFRWTHPDRQGFLTLYAPTEDPEAVHQVVEELRELTVDALKRLKYPGLKGEKNLRRGLRLLRAAFIGIGYVTGLRHMPVNDAENDPGLVDYAIETLLMGWKHAK